MAKVYDGHASAARAVPPAVVTAPTAIGVAAMATTMTGATARRPTRPATTRTTRMFIPNPRSTRSRDRIPPDRGERRSGPLRPARRAPKARRAAGPVRRYWAMTREGRLAHGALGP